MAFKTQVLRIKVACAKAARCVSHLGDRYDPSTSDVAMQRNAVRLLLGASRRAGELELDFM